MKKNNLIKVTMVQLTEELNKPLWLKEEEKKFESPSKPVRRYENHLFMLSMAMTLLAKVAFSFTDWRGFYFTAFFLVTISICISVFFLLFPPRYSNLRLVFILLDLICYDFIFAALGFWR